MGTLANSEDPDEMQHNGSALFAKIKQPLGTELHHNLENATYDPFKCTMGSPILIVSIGMGKSIRIQRVKIIHLNL